MLRNNFEVQVLINGNPAKEYSHNGKTYIEGKTGSRYSLKVKNNSCRKILAISSVDGLSVLDGELASQKSGGYIIDPYDSLVIDGWRKSDKEVAQFFFSDPSSSYAERTGKGQNQGVIGTAVFYEKEKVETKVEYKYIPMPYPDPKPPISPNPKWPTYPDYPFFVEDNINYTLTADNTKNMEMRSCAKHDSAEVERCSLSLSSMKQDLGTGWGEDKKSEVTKVSFDKESCVSAQFEIYYNTRKELKKLGIDFGSKPVYVAPQAFPGEYCKPPSR